MTFDLLLANNEGYTKNVEILLWLSLTFVLGADEDDEALLGRAARANGNEIKAKMLTGSNAVKAKAEDYAPEGQCFDLYSISTEFIKTFTETKTRLNSVHAKWQLYIWTAGKSNFWPCCRFAMGY